MNKHNVPTIIDLITLTWQSSLWFILETGRLGNMKYEILKVASVHVDVQTCRAFASEHLSYPTLCGCACVHVCVFRKPSAVPARPAGTFPPCMNTLLHVWTSGHRTDLMFPDTGRNSFVRQPPHWNHHIASIYICMHAVKQPPTSLLAAPFNLELFVHFITHMCSNIESIALLLPKGSDTNDVKQLNRTHLT